MSNRDLYRVDGSIPFGSPNDLAVLIANAIASVKYLTPRISFYIYDKYSR